MTTATLTALVPLRARVALKPSARVALKPARVALTLSARVALRLSAGVALSARIAVTALVASPVAVDAHVISASPAPLRMSVLGDSLALGTGASDPANAVAFRIYRALLAERPGSEVTNEAIGGSRVADVTRLQVPALDPRADLVLVIVGGNDVVRRTPARQFANEYARLLAAVRLRAPHAAVVACGVPDVARSPLFADSYVKTEALARADDSAVRAAARASGAAFADLFSLTRARGTNADFFSADDFHPSDTGYAQLESATLPAVRRALSAIR